MERSLILGVILVVCGSVGPSHTAWASAPKGAVASAHGLATKAGMDILQKGGNAVDAAVAVSLALSVVEPWSSGIGGGGFMVVRMAGKTHTWDFRETAPAAATRDMFQRNGRVVRGLSTTSWLAAGIPGLVRGLALVHKQYGRLPWKTLVEPSIRLARDGFPVSRHLVSALTGSSAHFNQAAKRVFLTQDGKNPAVGSILKQPDLAGTLVRIAQTKGEDFYTGITAKRLVKAVRKGGGLWTAKDLRDYRVKRRAPVVGTYRGYTIESMGPPSSGGLLLVQMLGVLERLGHHRLKPASSGYIHMLAEVMKRAFAMRAKGLGDPDFVPVKRKAFTGDSVVRRLAKAVRQARRATPAHAIGQVKVRPQERTDTSHFGILMANGDAVACTQTINLRFGNGKVAAGTGVVLNDEMDDFSAKPGAPNAFGLIGDAANAVAPGKRPLSSMTPTIVLRRGKAVGVFGSPGGSRIITTTLQSILNVIDRGWSVKRAISTPRLHHQWFPDQIGHEKGRIGPAILKELIKKGHKVVLAAPMGNAMALWHDRQGRLSAAADPRGEGTASVR